MNISRFALALGAALALAGCDESLSKKEDAAVLADEIDRFSQRRCSYEFRLSSDTAHSDISQVLRTNKLQVCRWVGQSKLTGFRPGGGSAQCRLPATTHLEIFDNEDSDQHSLADECTTPQPNAPSSSEAVGLRMFCYRMKFDNGRVASEVELLGTGSSLFIYFGFPVRYAAVESDKAMLWVDFRDYPWPNSFVDDVRAAAGSVGWIIDFAPCE
jgi:hypothetical protein